MGEINLNARNNVHKKYREMIFLNPYINTPPVIVNAPNTFIGGVASVINTPAQLAAKLSISVSDISNFIIVGNDIECYIGVNYTILSDAFKFNTDIVYFKDLSGFCKAVSSSAFQFCGNLSEFIGLGVTEIQSASFSYCLKLVSFQTPLLSSIIGQYSINRTAIRQLYFPNMINLSGLTSEIATPYKLIYMPNCLIIGGTTGNDNVMTSMSSGTNILTNISMKTSNGGAIEGDLLAKQTGGSILSWSDAEPVGLLDKPNPPTNLQLVFNSHNKAKIIYDLPTASTNAILLYEVWLNGIFYKEVTVLETYVSELTQGQGQKVHIVTVDIYGNRSINSASLNFISANDLVAVSTLGMRAYLKMDDALGSVVYDSFNEITYPIVGGGTLQNAGKLGTAIDFNKTLNQYVNMVRPFNSSNDLTVSMWVKVKTYSTPSSIWNYDYDRQGTINIESTGKIRFLYGIGASFIDSPTFIGDGAWHYVVCVREGTEKRAKVYIDGVSSGSATFPNSTFLNSLEDMKIGSGYRGASDTVVDEFSIYDRAWQSEEVLLNYNGGIGRTL